MPSEGEIEHYYTALGLSVNDKIDINQFVFMMGEIYKKTVMEADDTIQRIMNEFNKIDANNSRQLNINQLN